MRIQHLLAGTVLASTMTLAAPAFAQDTGAATTQVGVGDIIVTARRTSESLQVTPVAVTALSGETLEDQQIIGIQQLQSTTPNLTFTSAIAQPGSSAVFIRGQGSSDGLIAIDQAVGVYIDGVYAARSTGGATDLIDVERVEVLRGPQGTLFGRNTTGGAINIIAARPNDDKVEGSLRGDYGNYNSFLVRAALNVPVAEGLAVRGAFQHRERDGYGFNAFLNEEVGGETSDYARLSVLLEPAGSDLSILLQGDYSSLESGGEIVGLKSITPGAVIGGLQAVCGNAAHPAFGLCPSLPSVPLPFASYVLGQNGNTDPYRTFSGTSVYGESESKGLSMALEYELSDAVVFKSTTAWRAVDMESLTDNDGTPYAASGGLRGIPAIPGYTPQPGNIIGQDQFSQELQLSGDLGSLEYIVGGFYFVENGTDQSFSGSAYPLSTFAPPFTVISIVDGTVRNSSVAAYGQVIFNVTDTIRLTGGLRYTDDKRELSIRNRNLPASGIPTTALGNLPNDPNDSLRFNAERNFDYFSYLVSADWQAANNLFFYAKTSRSQRSGGLNTRAVAGGTPPLAFNPETVTDYEIGAKLDLLDRRVRLNLTAFNSVVDDVQRNLVGVAAGGGTLVSGIDNAAKARIRGIEAELTVIPVDGLTLGGNLGYTDAEYSEFINSIDLSDWSASEFPYAPKYTIGTYADFEADIGFATLKLHADYSWRAENYTQPIAPSAAARVGLTAEQLATLGRTLQDTALIPSYGVLNGRIALQFEDPNLEIAFYARNITKEEYFVRLLAVQATPLGFTSYTPGDPQTYGVSASIRF